MSYVFGPVPSRRLGLSLGVDLIPFKTCTYDCLYCQLGRTTHKTVETERFVPTEEVFEELEERLAVFTPDVITLSGSGEPTLCSEIDMVIAFIKTITDTKIAVLTNGSLFWREEVRRRVCVADIIMPTLTTAFEETFMAIHRSHSGVNLNMIIEGLKRFRQVYQRHLFLEVVLLAGFNDSAKELEGLKRVIDQISPDKIQLNTVVRPSSDHRAISLDKKRLEEIQNFFGEKAEIIAEAPLRHKRRRDDALGATVLEMARRRPLRAVDVAKVFSMSVEEVEDLMKSLEIKGVLHRQEHSGEVYYRG